jgi:iron complex transport system substrate-binding protein
VTLVARRPLAVLVAVLVLLVSACGSGATEDLPGAQPGAAGTAPTGATTVDPSTAETRAPGGTAASPQLPVTVTSADGRSVTVADVSRIVPLQGDLAEIVFDLGLGDNVVGRDISTTFEEASDLPLVTRAHDVSAESVLSLHPTLVLIDSDTGPPEAIQHIRNVGVPVVEFARPTRIAEIGDRIEAVAAALGVPAAGTSLAASIEDDLDGALADVPAGDPPRVAFLYLRGSAGVYLLGGPGSGADAMIAAAGGEDAGTAIGLDEPFTPITSEALVEAAPDVLLLTTTGLDSVGGIDGLQDIAGIAQTPAGRDRRVVTVEDGLLYSFGSRTPAAIESMVDQIFGGGGQ